MPHGNPAHWGFDMFFSLAMFEQGAYYASHNYATSAEFCGGFLPGARSTYFRSFYS